MGRSKQVRNRAAFSSRLRKAIRLVAASAAWIGCIQVISTNTGMAQESPRVRNGLVALYYFDSVVDGSVPDRSGLGDPADLKLGEPEAVRWKSGSLTLTQPTRLRSRDRPAKISDFVRVSGELSVEVWIEPSVELGSAPASIVAMSNGTDQRNFALIQDDGRFQAGFRTSQTGSDKASISTLGATAGPAPTHLVFTRDRSGRARMYLDGKIVVERILAGSVLDWEKTTLTIGNGPRGKLPWLGTYHLVAIYGRDLLADEVARNFRAGVAPPPTRSSSVSGNVELFESQIAPLLASRCMDCHDSAVREGGLDLSRC